MIGIFDSGVGGLTVVKELKKQLPGVSYIYLGDTARTPYGNRGPETIKRYAEEDVNFLIARGATVIVVACNTASAVAGEYLKQKFSLPIFEVITSAAQAAARVAKKKVGVIGTRATIGSDSYQRLLRAENDQLEIIGQTCPLLVPMVEENFISKPEMKMIIRRYLYPLKCQEIDTLILGCTHYPLIREMIQEKIGRRVKLIDPAREIIMALAEFLNSHPDSAKGDDASSRYFSTDINSRFKTIAESWLGEGIKVESADLTNL